LNLAIGVRVDIVGAINFRSNKLLFVCLSGGVMRRHWIAALGVSLLLTGCAAVRQPVQMQNRFDYDLHKPYTESGPNTIKGQGFLRQKGGGVVTCAGSQVIAMPDTLFFREFISLYKAGKKPQIPGGFVDPSYRSIIKQAQCDAQGNFTFSAVPNGNWFVMTEVKWAVGYAPQGGALMREVNVADGVVAQVLLSDKDVIGR
jgi:hypothetical protein